MDAGGIETLSFRAVWTVVDAYGHGLEIYGSEGWGFESLRACRFLKAASWAAFLAVIDGGSSWIRSRGVSFRAFGPRNR